MAKRKKSTDNNGFDRRHLNKGRVENLIPFKKTADNGGVVDPKINLSGRPKVLGESYRKVLEAPYAEHLKKLSPLMSETIDAYAKGAQVNYAEAIAIRAVISATAGDMSAAREIRAATEGDRLRTWEDDLADLVREGTATVDDVRTEFGNEIAARISVRLGVLPSQSRATAD